MATDIMQELQTIKTAPRGEDVRDAIDSALEKLSVSTTIIPKSIDANGTYNPTDDKANGYSPVTVNVVPKLIDKAITVNGEYPASADGVDGYSKVTVSVEGGKDANLTTKRITKSGVYKAIDDSVDGYDTVDARFTSRVAFGERNTAGYGSAKITIHHRVICASWNSGETQLERALPLDSSDSGINFVNAKSFEIGVHVRYSPHGTKNLGLFGGSLDYRNVGIAGEIQQSGKMIWVGVQATQTNTYYDGVSKGINVDLKDGDDIQLIVAWDGKTFTMKLNGELVDSEPLSSLYIYNEKDHICLGIYGYGNGDFYSDTLTFYAYGSYIKKDGVLIWGVEP